MSKVVENRDIERAADICKKLSLKLADRNRVCKTNK